MKGKFKEIVSKFPGWLDLLQKSPSVEGLGEFVNSFVYGSSRFANVHEIVFADRFYPVETGGLCSLRPDAGLIENPKKIRNTLA